ncbi:MAG: sulfatase-like hydrolase/transferase [Candidatus Aminicenantes bacterium]|nr:sulfatase-like hydrolase/transferase [Candidatus Aminicenantes bacterium]
MILAALGLVALTQCKKAEDENFLLITLDTQRADLIGAYRKSPVRTPNIDALAENGILFETCLSPIPITLPAHATMFFSLYPHQMHLYNNGQIKEPDDKKPSLATFFKNRGFATAAFVSLGVLKKEFGLNEGFDVYQSHFPRDDYYINAGEVNRRALPWFRETSGKPFFAWVHYSDPHAPY